MSRIELPARRATARAGEYPVMNRQICPLPRKAPLCAGLCLALALASTAAPLLAAPSVDNCGDDGLVQGSLRYAIAHAASGETIDLSQLPTKCGGAKTADAVITLENGEIPIGQDVLKLQGPSVGTVTIEPAAGSQSRVFEHTGANAVELAINDLTIANGNLALGAGYDVYGGCISSDGTVFLTRSTVRDCTAGGHRAVGGGIFAVQGIILLHSTITGNKALGSADGEGGGVYTSGGLTLSYSTVSNNEASDIGGGIHADSFLPGVYSHVYNSTIEGNVAARSGAAAFETPHGIIILNTTISGNITTSAGDDALFVEGGSVYIANSTIAFNSGGGVYMFAGNLTLQSSIIAHNASPGLPDFNWDWDSTVTGADNLVMSPAIALPGVIKLTSDPKLGPLQYNGGRTRTHMLLAGSPAIGAGNDNWGMWTDQRGWGYPRTTPAGGGYLTDIGAVQREWIFHGDFDDDP
jgi:hypothetical protein